MTDPLLEARAAVLADLASRNLATRSGVSVLEEALSQRGWWIEQWPEGATFVRGLVAQDVQDALFDAGTRWPVCTTCPEVAEHSLHVEPDLGGPDPTWTCGETGVEVAPVGAL